MRPQTIKLEENIVSKFFDIALSSICVCVCVAISPQARETKKKSKQIGLHQTKSFCTVEETINKIKRQLTGWGIVTSDTSNKGLICRIYKELIQLTIKYPQTN